MSEYIQIQWTAGSIDEARKVARFLVQERLVACAKIVPWVESIYMWNNQLETAQESLITLIAPHANYDQVKSVILKNTSYQVPEIIYLPIEGGNREYLEWVKQSAFLASSPSLE